MVPTTTRTRTRTNRRRLLLSSSWWSSWPVVVVAAAAAVVAAVAVVVNAAATAAGARTAFVTPDRHSGRRTNPLNKATTTSTFLTRRSRRRRTTAAAAASDDRNDGDEKVNDKKKKLSEWGIPYNADLPPLHVVPSGTKVPNELPNGGKVTLVGSGPGDPDLLTVAAYRLLTEHPDALVVADRLVSQEILDLVSCSEIKTARKLPGCADLAQDEIYWWVYQALREGRHVIRLKIGYVSPQRACIYRCFALFRPRRTAVGFLVCDPNSFRPLSVPHR